MYMHFFPIGIREGFAESKLVWYGHELCLEKNLRRKKQYRDDQLRKNDCNGAQFLSEDSRGLSETHAGSAISFSSGWQHSL